VLGELGRGGGLASTLQAGHQDHGWRLGGEVDVRHAFAHRRGEFAVDDSYQRLSRGQRPHDLCAERFFLDAGDEVTHHRQGHVGLEQRHAHLAHHVLDVVFGDARLAAHGFDEPAQPIGEGRCHLNGARAAAAGRESTL